MTARMTTVRKNLANGVSFMVRLLLHRLLALSGLLCRALGLELGELLFGLNVSRLGFQRLEAAVERGFRKFLTEIRGGDGRLDVLAHVVERLDLGVHREPLELILN